MSDGSAPAAPGATKGKGKRERSRADRLHAATRVFKFWTGTHPADFHDTERPERGATRKGKGRGK